MFTLTLVLCCLGTVVDSVPSRTVDPACLDLGNGLQQDLISLQLEHTLAGRGVSLHTERQARNNCDTEAFLAEQETCVNLLLSALEDNSSITNQVIALKEFCRSCVEEFVDFWVDECDASEDAPTILLLHYLCAEGPRGQLCGELAFRSTELDDPLRVCGATDQSNCSSQCRKGVEDYTDYYGCCLGEELPETNDTNTTILQLYSSCDVDIPEGCDEGESDDDLSALELVLIIGLPSALLIGSISVFLIGCIVYYGCRSKKSTKV